MRPVLGAGLCKANCAHEDDRAEAGQNARPGDHRLRVAIADRRSPGVPRARHAALHWSGTRTAGRTRRADRKLTARPPATRPRGHHDRRSFVSRRRSRCPRVDLTGRTSGCSRGIRFIRAPRPTHRAEKAAPCVRLATEPRNRCSPTLLPAQPPGRSCPNLERQSCKWSDVPDRVPCLEYQMRLPTAAQSARASYGCGPGPGPRTATPRPAQNRR